MGIKDKKVTKKFGKACERVSQLTGVCCMNCDGKNFAISGGSYDDYLALLIVAELIKKGDLKISFKNEEDIRHLRKYLGIDKEE